MPSVSLQAINVGRYPNDGTGDNIRDAFRKINSNFNVIVDGITGIQGLAGPTGPTGPQGNRGLQGFQGLSGIGVTQHRDLAGLNVANSHPITAITNLETILNTKLAKVEFINLGNVTDINVTPIITNDRIYQANLTGNGVLTINSAGLNEYAICLIVLTSSSDGTFTLSIPNNVYWMDGEAIEITPIANQVFHLYMQSINNVIFLTVTTWGTAPA